ncbi:hypothetical protein CfE428DRAFT_3639 [Chthoniobacter flavus Ellin428]|uniref:Uncharacterized protein n=1 Tax=Chthoniobacter flavus Ellin428 TaxID=497964 RepID=B4D401_9BACT|nr:hypothetical protein CfE428DRAFT_3639 [Chthoniobacter flavus Ellin428]
MPRPTIALSTNMLAMMLAVKPMMRAAAAPLRFESTT